MVDTKTKRAITYGILAHINNTKKLTKANLTCSSPL